MANKKVYVVSWEFNTGGGFDWYFDRRTAKRAYKAELENERYPILAEEGWKASFHTYNVRATKPEAITDEVEYKLYRRLK